MSEGLDDKLARALALSVSQQPRANLQQLARAAGISKATLYRISPTREGVIDLLMERATQHLQDALARADLETPPHAAALQRLTEAVVQGREYYLFWNHAEWIRVIDARTEDANVPIPSFYGEALETFFLNGQKAGVFRIDVPSLWLVRAYDYLLYAAMDAAQRGEIAPLGMASMVQKLFLEGAAGQPGLLNHAKRACDVNVRTRSWHIVCAFSLKAPSMRMTRRVNDCLRPRTLLTIIGIIIENGHGCAYRAEAAFSPVPMSASSPTRSPKQPAAPSTVRGFVDELLAHYRDLQRHLSYQLRNPDDAADIAQASFERVYANGLSNARKNGPGIESLRGLLFRVAHNLCIDEARRRKVSQGAPQKTENKAR